MRAINHPEYTSRAWPESRRIALMQRARERAEERERESRSTMIVWLREQEAEDVAEIKGMIGTGADLYAIKRRIELEARLDSWRKTIAFLKKTWRTAS